MQCANGRSICALSQPSDSLPLIKAVQRSLSTRRPKYKTLRELLARELVLDEHTDTAILIKSLRHVRRDQILTKPELVAICRWKSPRAICHIESNHAATVRALTRRAFSTRSEQKRIEYLTQLRGVSLPMASAVLMLTEPKRYGVIDIRVWQTLFAIGSVTKNPRGVNFNFKQWYHYLSKLRYHADALGVSVRTIERSLFLYHKKLQDGLLYAAN